MVEVINIADHLPPSNPDIVESCKVITSEAQNGRVTSILFAWVDDQGQVHAAYHIETPVAVLALGALVDFEQLDEFIS